MDMRFSPRERLIIKSLGRKKLSIEEITIEVFKNSRDRPIDDKVTIANSIRRIMKKCERYKLDWTFEKLRENNRVLVKRVSL